MDILEYGYEPPAHGKKKKGQFVEDPYYTMAKSLPKDVGNEYYIPYVRYVGLFIYSLLLVTKLTEEPRALVSIYN